MRATDCLPFPAATPGVEAASVPQIANPDSLLVVLGRAESTERFRLRMGLEGERA